MLISQENYLKITACRFVISRSKIIECRAMHKKKIAGYLGSLLFCVMYLTEKVLRGSFTGQCSPRKPGPFPSGRRMLQNHSVEDIFNITWGLHGFLWQKSNIALRDEEHHPFASTLTCCQCPPTEEHFFCVIAMQNLLDRKISPVVCIPVLPITTGYNVVLPEILMTY